MAARPNARATGRTSSHRRPRGDGPRRASRRYDPAALSRCLVEVISSYAGDGRTIGRRTTWNCPTCGKRKLEAVSDRGLAGCWNSQCELPTTTDAIGIVAFFEGLDRRGPDFVEILKRGYERAGLEPQVDTHEQQRRGADAPPDREDPAPPNRSRPVGPRAPNPDPDPDLLDFAYRGFLALCPLSGRDRAFWRGRGVNPATVQRGRFASATAAAARGATARLASELGREALLRVPGFFENGRGHLSFTLTGDYALVPYFDAHGRVVTIEGRATDAQRRRLRRIGMKAKYVSLRNSGNHLYLFPGLDFDRIEAFTEGTVGAIVAAQEGITVASIKGIRCFRGPGGGPLPELKGADFGGRTVPYIPDADDPPIPDVLEAAPDAAIHLAVPQGGRPAIAALPRGTDLDEWLLSLPDHERKPAFARLMAAARPPAI